MSWRTDHEELLADVLAEESRAGFEEALLGETLRLARRRRQIRRASTITALLLLAGFGVWHSVPRGKHTIEIAPAPNAQTPFQLVVSQPLPASLIVTTQPLANKALQPVEFTAQVINTYDGGFREVGDDELLNLAAPRTAALIRRGPHEAELVLVSALGKNALREN